MAKLVVTGGHMIEVVWGFTTFCQAHIEAGVAGSVLL